MLHRNNKVIHPFVFYGVFIFLSGFFAASPAGAQNIFITFYQEHISAADGDRCRMYPSCSSYASTAIDKHGLVLGWVMACDRLVRCGRDETKISLPVLVDNQEYIYDPVEANDFWWFEKEKKQ